MSDLISRQAAIDTLKKAYWDKDIQFAKDDPCIVDAMTDWAIRQIKDLSSAQPERKKGRWIFEECKGNTYFRCSECGEIVTSAIMGFPRYEYCPMCGADMRGEEE